LYLSAMGDVQLTRSQKEAIAGSDLVASGQRLPSSQDSHCDILFVVTHLLPGGTREALVFIARELKALGLQIGVVALYRGRTHCADLRGLDCDILVDRDQLSMAGYAQAFVRLNRRIKAMRPGAILCFMPAANVMGGISAALAGVRRRVASHHQTRTAQHRILRAIDRVLGSIGIYSQVITVSESVRASFSRYSPAYLNRVRVIPNAIRPIVPHVDKLTVRKSLGIAADAMLLAAIGRLSPEKNLLRTLVGMSRVQNAHLVLVGDGPQRSEIESYIASAGLERRVLLAGQVDRQAAVDILFASDVFIQLSLFEGRSIALLEALSASKPILASDIEAQREVLTMEDGTFAGMLVDPTDQDAIANAILTIANSEGLRLELGTKAGALAARLDPFRMAQDYVALLKGRI
jgi:glycosyltransferase involved in cell wall biosynthesis